MAIEGLGNLKNFQSLGKISSGKEISSDDEVRLDRAIKTIKQHFPEAGNLIQAFMQGSFSAGGTISTKC